MADWEDAVNDDGLVRIPLRNPHGYSWTINLGMGTPIEPRQFCSLDNNHNLNMVFDRQCKTCPHTTFRGYSPWHSDTFYSKKDQNMTMIHDDGFTVFGTYAKDFTCLSMMGTKKQASDDQTKVCNRDQKFFMVNNMTEWDWDGRVAHNYYADAVCGLGKEKASNDSESFIARAVYNEDIKRNAYSVTLVPQKLALPIAMDPSLPRDRKEKKLM